MPLLCEMTGPGIKLQSNPVDLSGLGACVNGDGEFSDSFQRHPRDHCLAIFSSLLIFPTLLFASVFCPA